MKIAFFASALATASAGGSLAITWSDCGKSTTHGKTTDVKPTSLPLGAETSITGTGTLDKTVSGGTYDMEVKAGGGIIDSHFKGNNCEKKSFNLPLGLGTLDWEGLTCPQKKGAVHIHLKTKLASALPPALATSTIALKAKDQDSEDLLCVNLKLAKATDAVQQPSFEEWQAQYGINSADEEMRAKYEANVRIINDLNARDPSATYAVNKFSGMTHEEFAAIYLTLKTSPVEASDLPMLGSSEGSVSMDDSVDWDVTPVKDQGNCGSCWTFGVMGAIEGLNKVQTGKEVILSEQQLVDCDKDGINDGCNGGLTDYAYKYLTGKDLYTLDSYPYVSGQTGQGGSCKSGVASGVTLSGYFTVDGVGSGSAGDSALAAALMNGPVTVTVAVDNQFANYHSGVMTGVPTACNLNHAILATGFGPGFWKIKNSWGASWGDQGFAKFERTTSGCGPYGIFFQDAGFQPQLGSSSISV